MVTFRPCKCPVPDLHVLFRLHDVGDRIMWMLAANGPLFHADRFAKTP